MVTLSRQCCCVTSSAINYRTNFSLILWRRLNSFPPFCRFKTIAGQVSGAVVPAPGGELQHGAEADGSPEHRGRSDGQEPDARHQPGPPLGTQHTHRGQPGRTPGQVLHQITADPVHFLAESRSYSFILKFFSLVFHREKRNKILI